jgi:hypothetical protein
LLVLNVPLFDTGFVLVLRRFAGRKASEEGPSASPPRSLGFSERSTSAFYLLALSGGLIVDDMARGLQPFMPGCLFGVFSY